MFIWELRKLTKEKVNIIALILMIILFLQISIVRPMLETQNEYYDEAKNQYIIDSRDKEVIANEKLKSKVEEIKESSKLISTDKVSKEINKISSEKLKLDKGSNYEDVSFYKVLAQRTDYGLSMILMMIIIVMICSNLYTEEQLSNVSPIILSSKNKEKVLYSKLGIAVLLPIILYMVYFAGAFLITYMQYGKPLNGNLQAYRICDIALLVKNMTINNYIFSKMITSILMLSGVSVVSLLSSFINKNSVGAIGLSVGFIGIGKILTMFKFLPEKLLLILGAGNYVDVMMGMTKISGFYNGEIEILSKYINISNLCIGIYGLIIVLGILGNIYCIRKFLTK